MNQQAIPFYFMRGGTSRGPYFSRHDLPDNQDELAEILIKVIGSGNPLNIDGIGGGNAVTTKVAMLSPSLRDDCDIDYFFAQVTVEDKLVDFKPTCGNILSGVGPAAIEMGFVKPQDGETEIIIHAVNTGAKVKSIIKSTLQGVIYHGDQEIAGVPGTAAPVFLHFMDIVGSQTGQLLPTGNVIDTINGYDVTCMDVTMPMVIGKASDFGITGYESADELNDNKELFAKIEDIRITAGKNMGMGDVSKSVMPKFGLLAPPRNGGTITARYFMPWKAHPAMAVTGAQCIASCAVMNGTVAENLSKFSNTSPITITLEHPTGIIDVIVDWQNHHNFHVNSAGMLRTARKIAMGHVFV